MKFSRSIDPSGFTLTETIVAVIILVISSSAIIIGTRQIFINIEKIINYSRRNNELILLESSLRAVIANVKPPFWEKSPYPTPEKSSGIVTLPYYRGIKNREIKTGFSKNGFIIKKPDGTINLFYFAGTEDTHISESSTGIITVSVTVMDAEGDLNLIIPFGSVPLKAGIKN